MHVCMGPSEDTANRLGQLLLFVLSCNKFIGSVPQRYTTKEEDVAKISTSLFITNFPESTSAKELFNACKQYGHVVDTFIPTKRSKARKRFGFVRFINVFSAERLVNNLCTVWIDRDKLHANVARFNSALVNSQNHATQNVGGSQVQSGIMEEEMSPALVLDDNCLMSKDVSKCLLGRVKEFASLANLKMALYNEGFMDIKIQYMGEFWVLMEFVNGKSLKLFRDNVSANSWFSQVIQAFLDFVTEGRIAWVEIEGIPIKIWSDNTFKRIAAKWGELLDIDDHEETCFHSKRLCILTKDYRSFLEDFKIVFRGKVFWIRAKETPGWVPEFMDDEDDDDQTDDQYDDEINNGGINGQETSNGVNSDAKEVPETAVGEEGQEENNADKESLEKTGDKSEDPFNIYPLLNKNNNNGMNNNASVDNLKYPVVIHQLGEARRVEVESDSICSSCFKKSKGPKTGGSILNLLDEVAKVGQVMGFFVMMRGLWRQSGKDVLLIAVYAPHDFKEKLLLWDYLNRSIGRWYGEVIIMGDFSEVRYKSDRFGTVFHTQGANAFNSFIYSAGLAEVSLGGCSFTYLFDHRPILLRESYFDYGPTPFRFFHYWSDLEGFGNVVEAAWKEYPNVEQNAMINMMGKLKHLKKKIRKWNIKDKQQRSMDKDKYKVDLEALDTIIDQGNGNEEIVKQRLEIVSKLLHIDKLSSVEMAQKAKVKWSIERDENNSFFHRVINKKRNLPNIRGIIVDGSWVDEPSMSELEGEVSNDEIKSVVWDCGTDKAPGPDGFTFGFYRRFWYLIDYDVYAAVKHFFIHGEIPKGCNSSFIALIPKIPDANLVKDFRTISFIRSLQILDGQFVLNEVIQWCKLKKKQSLVFKVDFEKANDSVRWDFLDDILGKFDFGDKWRMWIQSCLKSSRGSIIINGSPTEEFQFFKGIKQGDPLSPFLFILVMESLHLSFQRVEKAKMFKGIKISLTVTLSHMFYANDAVFVGKWCESNITTLVHVLDCFHRASGLKINMSKSKILRVHVKSDRVKEAALRLGCLTLKTPFLYLGSKVGGSMYRLHEWDEVVERVKMRNRFSRLYTLESCKRITVGEKMRQPSLEFSFRGNIRGGMEQEQLGDLVTLMHDVSLSPMADRWTWALENSGEFTVSSVRKHIDDKLIPGVGSKTRWIKYVPIKVNVNAWKVKLDALPTRFNVSRRGIHIDSIMCAVCDQRVETSGHLFFFM
uniref:RNA-directed DNA polymerase, eukaryota, reverse transcriptase zinc-binding domain protein n=1 Tax=Tanacetum cinerariifolium TaxID=118510 RepID=A0A6L2JR56_TANCI|nr:RNA-directed DNA polymerase, eukaryota, reverse transcriptase zinc-binding domain protein [Tanacetum cinerariifolium]